MSARRAAVLFDLDGCLVDSRAGILASVHVAMAVCGLPAMPDPELEWLIGPPLRTGFADLCRRAGVDDHGGAMAQALLDAYRADYHDTMLDHTPLVPGVEELLRRLAGDRPIGIVTSKPRVLAVDILEHHELMPLMSVVEGPSFDEADEPKTDTLARALSTVAPASTMVGDRHHDIDAGRAHGLRTIGVTWGIGSAAELGEAGADAVVDSVPALEEELLR